MLSDFKFDVIDKEVSVNSIIVDNKIVYYGGINPFIDINYDESIMRIDNIDFVKDFIKEINRQ